MVRSFPHHILIVCTMSRLFNTQYMVPILYLICLLTFRTTLCLRCYNCMNIWARERNANKNGSITWGGPKESNPSCGRTRAEKHITCDEIDGPYKQYCATSVLVQYQDQVPVLKKIRRNCPTRSVRDKWMYNLHARNGCTPFRAHMVTEGVTQTENSLTISIKERYCFCSKDFCNAASKDQLTD